MGNVYELVERVNALKGAERKEFLRATKLKKRGSKAPVILLLLIVALAAGVWFGGLPYMYNMGTTQMAAGNWDEAIETFNLISFYSDSQQQIALCNEQKIREANLAAYNQAEACLAAGKYDEAIAGFTALGDFSDAAAQVEVARTAKAQAAYDAAAALLTAGKYDEAIAGFTALGDFSDAAAQVEIAKTAKAQAAYDAAAALLAAGDFDGAIAAFTALGDFSDAAAQVEVCQAAKLDAAYQSAVTLYNEGAYRAAAEAFAALDGYKDSAAYAANAREFFPSVTDCASSINTSVGRTTTFTANVTAVSSIEELTIECADQPTTTYTITNNMLIPSVTSIATLEASSLENNVLTVTVKGGNTNGSTSIVIKDKEGIELATVAVQNSGLTDTQNANINKVHYMADAQFFFYDDRDSYVLNFSLKDSNEVRIAACCFVNVRIENANGVVVYEKEHFLTESNFGTWTSSLYGERKMAGLYIQPEEIQEGDTTSGTVYFTITLPNGVGFTESKTSASELPTHDASEDCSLNYPALPVSTTYYSRTTIQVTSLTYDFTARTNGNVDLKIYLSGVKTYDRDGNNHSEAGRIGYKLYDPEGYVIKSGTVSTTDVAVGERFRDTTLSFYDLVPGEYKLVLLDVN